MSGQQQMGDQPTLVNGVNDEPTYYSHSNNKDEDKLLLEPYTYLVQNPGKNVRKKLVAAFNLWLRVPEVKMLQVGEIVQLMHNSSLLIDDIEDSSEMRRGFPTAHKIFGEASTINCANYMYTICLERVLELGQGEMAVKIFCEQMLELHRGQGMEIYWRDNGVCPTEEEYRNMVIRKTGGLFNLAIRLMLLFAEGDEAHQKNYLELINLIGVYFQIRDDYANLCLDEYASAKSFADDLTEGKFSFPTIHQIKTQPNDRRVSNILRQKTKDNEVKKYCISLLEAGGSLEYTRSVLRDLDRKVRLEIEHLGGNSLLVSIMDDLKNWD